jgi:peptidoglycan hydrolase-like protein with peptidoglycan-binding domain/murein DD-endopeptidase MepM/ murein hydrolase activator NlpD
MANHLYDKTIIAGSEYAIYFDDVRMDQFITNWSASVSVDGGISTASIEMIYLPDLYHLHSSYKSISVGGISISDSHEVGEGIENMTNVYIFVKNQFSNKFDCVFNGNIHAKSLTKAPNGLRISFSASDYITWFNKTIVPLAIPGTDKLTFPDRMRWKAQGINLDNIDYVNQWREIHFRGKNIEQMWTEITKRTMSANMIYAQSEVAAWDNALGRVVHMADIDPKYTKETSALDFIVTSEATSVNSIYVLMNDLIKSVLLEFYQDGPGNILIKAPFWSEPILKNHVIDPAMILNFSESVNWDSEYSRIIATGGLEWWEGDQSEAAKSYITPTAVYRTDDTYSTSATGPAGGGVGEGSAIDITGGRTGTWLDNYTLTSGYGWRNSSQSIHYGIDWGMVKGTPIKHLGNKGKVVKVEDMGSEDFGKYVVVEIVEGLYTGYTVYYAHLSQFSVTIGKIVEEGTLIGLSGNTGKVYGVNGGYHLHFGVKPASGGWENPMDYLIASSGGVSNKKGLTMSIGDDALLTPTDYEKKYGPSIFNVNQPMIKFSTASSTAGNNRDSMFQMLVSYSKFMLNYLNSVVNVATVQMIAMPWLKPGFNIWLDPVGIDRVYYVSTIAYQGSAENGTYMNLGLTMGRTLDYFINNKDKMGGLNPNHSGNIFVNQLNDHYKVADGDFGKIVGKTASDYTKLRDTILKFHMNSGTKETSTISAKDSKYYKSLYSKETATSSNKQTGDASDDNTKSSDIDPNEWNRTLYKGCSGSDVKELQELLIGLGYNTGEDGTSGKFDTSTRNAVIRFQRANNLTRDGKVGPKTKAALAKKNTSSTSILSECTSILRRGSEGKYVTEVQKILKAEGLYDDTINGKFDVKTENAVIEFQIKHNLQQHDGIVGPKTRAALLSL